MARGVKRYAFGLPRLYWPYQLAFAGAQLASALLAAALLVHTPSVARALFVAVPPLLSLVSLDVWGPREKVGLVVEADRLVLAGTSIQFAEIDRVVHCLTSTLVTDAEGSANIVHTWTLRLQLLRGRTLVVYSRTTVHPQRDPRPPPQDPYGAVMARVIRGTRAVWFCSLAPSKFDGMRLDLLRYRRYQPAVPGWQHFLATRGFSLAALGLATTAGIGFAVWLAQRH